MIFNCLFRQASLIINTAVLSLEVTRWILLVVVGVSTATVDALILVVLKYNHK